MAVERICPDHKVQRFTSDCSASSIAPRRASAPSRDIRDTKAASRSSLPADSRARPIQRLGFFVAALFIDRVCEFCRSRCQDGGLFLSLQVQCRLPKRLFGKVRSSGEHLDGAAEPKVGIGIEPQLFVALPRLIDESRASEKRPRIASRPPSQTRRFASLARSPSCSRRSASQRAIALVTSRGP